MPFLPLRWQTSVGHGKMICHCRHGETVRQRAVAGLDAASAGIKIQDVQALGAIRVPDAMRRQESVEQRPCRVVIRNRPAEMHLQCLPPGRGVDAKITVAAVHAVFQGTQGACPATGGHDHGPAELGGEKFPNGFLLEAENRLSARKRLMQIELLRVRKPPEILGLHVVMDVPDILGDLWQRCNSRKTGHRTTFLCGGLTGPATHRAPPSRREIGRTDIVGKWQLC